MPAEGGRRVRRWLCPDLIWLRCHIVLVCKDDLPDLRVLVLTRTAGDRTTAIALVHYLWLWLRDD